MIKRVCILLSYILFAGSTFSITDVVNIGLFYKNNPKKVNIYLKNSEYKIITDDNSSLSFAQEQLNLSIENQNNRLVLRINGQNMGKYEKIYLRRKKWGAAFQMKTYAPVKSGVYEDNLMIYPYGKDKLKCINNVYIEHYVEGVVEAETGLSNHLEFYKVQAVITRTYALANLQRHKKEGFNLCDDVHCQVYKGKSRHSATIEKAVLATKGIVIVDSEIDLITAGFHSNCGGQTANSEDVWKKPVSYLRSVCDTFCTDQPHAYWEKKISKKQWIDYYEKYFNKNLKKDTLYLYCLTDHCQDERAYILNYLDSTTLLTKIRKDWRLKSTYFTIEEKNDTIHIYGHGFGHGVGLCQEGAMKMAELGYTYDQILHFYYSNIHLIHLSALNFFKYDIP